MIHALMITGKDRHHEYLSRRSIASFRQQTHPDKTLVIVNDGSYSLADCAGDGIVEIRLTTRRTLGELRNVALQQLPKGEIWVQWDDDDWQHRDRLASQHQHLLAHDAEVCFLMSQIHFAFADASAWVDRRIFHDGTIMMFKDDTTSDPHKRAFEDCHFRDRLLEKGRRTISLDNNPMLHLRLIHYHNAMTAEHFELNRSRKNRWGLGSSATAYVRDVVCETDRELLFGSSDPGVSSDTRQVDGVFEIRATTQKLGNGLIQPEATPIASSGGTPLPGRNRRHLGLSIGRSSPLS